MEEVLRDFLVRLEAIEKDYDGLGDTIVRDLMGEDIHRGFFRLEPDFQPSDDYTLDPEANVMVADAIARFVKDAKAAAEREGLVKFHQRVDAFQNLDVKTPEGADYNDYFSCVDALRYDQHGNELPETGPTPKEKANRHAWRLNRKGSLEDLLAALNRAGPWRWNLVGQDYEPYLEAQTVTGVRAILREEYEEMAADGSVSPPEYGYFALLAVTPEATATPEEVVENFLGALLKTGATDLTVASPDDL